MIIEVLAGIVALCLFYIVRFKFRSSYWSKLGVKQPAENPFPFGNNPVTCWDRLSGKINIGAAAYEQHREFAGEKVYGTYMLGSCKPAIGIRDPDLIRDVLVKDFAHFVDRGRPLFGTDGHSKTDLAWRKQMSSAIGEEWKELRSMFSPIFTSGKLRTMMDLITNVSKDIEKNLAKQVEMGGEVELKELFGKFSMDAIASCVFGIDAGSFKNDSANETEFVKNAKSIFTM